MAVENVTGYTGFEQGADGTLTALAHTADGSSRRVPVRVTVEREHRRADGTLVAAGEVASSDADTVKVGG